MNGGAALAAARPVARAAVRAVAAGLLVSIALAPHRDADGAPLPGDSVLGRAGDEDPKAFLKRVRSDLAKVDASIDATKELLSKSKDSAILADVLLRLAELYVEKSRLLYYRAVEERGARAGGEAISAPESKYFKELAIELYRRILREFPGFLHRDKVRFYLGHEHQELSQRPEMLREYKALIAEHPDSPLVPETYLLLGNFYFENRDLDEARKHYAEVVARRDTGLTALARYKLGWIAMNHADHKAALAEFEGAARAADEAIASAASGLPAATAQKLRGVRREALVDSVQPFTEVKKPEEAVVYYGALADSRTLYAAILEKLGNRYYVQQNWGPASKVYRTLLTLTHDVERAHGFGRRFVECAQKVLKDPDTAKRPLPFVADDARVLTEIAARYASSWRIPRSDREAARKEFEVYVRDIATRIQLASEKEPDPARKVALAAEAARAYQAHLSYFDDRATRLAMEENHAEALAAAGLHWEAGRAFETVARERKSGEREAIHDALAEYHLANADRDRLGRFRRVQAREAEKQLGEYYAKIHPDGRDVAAVTFNVARAHYEEGDYKTAIALFRDYLRAHPGTKEAYAAANLVLDSLAQLEDLDGLSETAKAFSTDPTLPDPAFRRKAAEIGKQADFRRVGSVLAETDGGEDPAEKLARLAESSAGSELGEKALYTLFITHRDRGEPEKIYDAGTRFLARYARSELAPEVLQSITRLAIDSADFGRAAGYFEAYVKARPGDKEAWSLLERAAAIREKLGQADRAAVDYQRLSQAPGGISPAEAARRSIAAYRAVGDWAKAAEAAKRLIQAGGDGPLARFVVGDALWRAGKMEEAKLELVAAVDSSRAAKALRPEDRDAAAEAAFLLTEETKRALEAIRYASAEDLAAIERRLERVRQLESEAAEVVKLGSPEWAIAALFRVGQAYRGLAEFLRAAPEPPALSAEERAEYRRLLEEKALPIDQKARTTFGACVAKGNELNVLSPWLSACAALGARGEPSRPSPPPPRAGRFRSPSEIVEALRRDPLNAGLLARLATAYLQAGDPYAAELIARRAVEVDESRSESHGLLAIALLRRGEVGEAGVAFAAAAERAPGAAKPWLNLAAHEYAYADPRKAIETLRRAINARTVDPAAVDVHPGARRLMADAPRLLGQR